MFYMLMTVHKCTNICSISDEAGICFSYADEAGICLSCVYDVVGISALF
jgi:hypothetical protein